MDSRERDTSEGHKVKRVALPSGKTIEVVYFEPVAQPLPPEQGGKQVGEQVGDLHVCPECSSKLVYPTHWSEVDRVNWEVTLRCPNCEWDHTGVYDQETVEDFDEELDRGTDDLVDDLKRLIHANMEEEIERFSSALVNDYILPEDF
jgi:DNA-directed RNA polymerase subunit RPC12/RpoP